MSERIRGKIIHDWQDKGIVLILGDDRKKYLGHWDFAKRGKAKQGKRVYFYPGKPEILPDGTIANDQTAVDILRFAELPEDEQKNWHTRNAQAAEIKSREKRIIELQEELAKLTGECGDMVHE